MSKLIEVSGTTVIQVAPAAKRLPPNPIFLERTPGPNTLAISNRSTLSSVEPHREDKGFRNKLLVKDRRSFLTGSAHADLQGCHLISTIRGSTADKLKTKIDIVRFCSLTILPVSHPIKGEILVRAKHYWHGNRFPTRQCLQWDPS